VVGTGSRDRNIKEGDVTDVVIKMYLYIIQVICIKFFRPAKTIYVWVDGKALQLTQEHLIQRHYSEIKYNI
jgi:hypothetical protein